jgi:hypothetical protein
MIGFTSAGGDSPIITIPKIEAYSRAESSPWGTGRCISVFDVRKYKNLSFSSFTSTAGASSSLNVYGASDSAFTSPTLIIDTNATSYHIFNISNYNYISIRINVYPGDLYRDYLADLYDVIIS